MGVCTRLSQSKALALPIRRISNTRSPRQEILYDTLLQKERRYNTPNMNAFVAVSSPNMNLRDSRLEDNVRKRPF